MFLEIKDTEEIKPIYSQRDTATPEYITDIAHTKRFLERWVADETFREELPKAPYEVAKRYKLQSDPEVLRLLWDVVAAQDQSDQKIFPVPLSVERYRAFIKEKITHRHRMQTQDCIPDHPYFKAWRRQQMARCYSQLGLRLYQSIVHSPVSFELSKGCSVGCWFCGIAAPKLEDVFLYTKANAKLWEEVLEVVREIIGPAAAQGFCYWATDPLDNPDYELLISDFHKVLGRLPQTTTAQAMDDPERTRRLLKLSQEKNGWLDRFSILSLKTFNEVTEEFTPEELIFVELINQNKESEMGKHVAGRAREKMRKQAIKNEQESPNDAISGTIACISGFLFNMVEKKVRLISPCNADERWPLGYRIYQEGYFSDGKSLKALMTEMITNHMYPTIRHRDEVSYRRDLQYEKVNDGCQFSSAFIKQTLFDNQRIPHLREVSQLIAQGKQNAGDLALKLFDEEGIALEETFHALNALRQLGVLDDEPTPVAYY